MTIDERAEHMEGYRKYMKLQGLKMSTIGERLVSVKVLLDYLEEKDLPANTIRMKEAREFQKYIIERGEATGSPYAGGTILNYMYMAGSFFAYLKSEGRIFTNPFKDIKKIPAASKLPKHILQEEQMKELLDWFRNFQEEPNLQLMRKRYRLHVVVELLYSTGMRISEVGKLRVEDVNLEAGCVKVRSPKEKRDRLCFLNDYAREVLRIYINQMRTPCMDDKKGRSDRLFGSDFRAIKNKLNAELKRACSELDLPAQSSKCFRHAVGFHLLRNGCNIRYIQAVLGHISIRSTEVYTKILKEDLLKVVDKYHPRKWNHETQF